MDYHRNMVSSLVLFMLTVLLAATCAASVKVSSALRGSGKFGFYKNILHVDEFLGCKLEAGISKSAAQACARKVMSQCTKAAKGCSGIASCIVGQDKSPCEVLKVQEVVYMLKGIKMGLDPISIPIKGALLLRKMKKCLPQLTKACAEYSGDVNLPTNTPFQCAPCPPELSALQIGTPQYCDRTPEGCWIGLNRTEPSDNENGSCQCKIIKASSNPLISVSQNTRDQEMQMEAERKKMMLCSNGIWDQSEEGIDCGTVCGNECPPVAPLSEIQCPEMINVSFCNKCRCSGFSTLPKSGTPVVFESCPTSSTELAEKLVGTEQPNNILTTSSPNAGDWGGECLCPDGSMYYVGDNFDSCATMRCEGGFSGRCFNKSGVWSGNSVQCGAGKSRPSPGSRRINTPSPPVNSNFQVCSTDVASACSSGNECYSTGPEGCACNQAGFNCINSSFCPYSPGVIFDSSPLPQIQQGGCHCYLCSGSKDWLPSCSAPGGGFNDCQAFADRLNSYGISVDICENI